MSLVKLRHISTRPALMWRRTWRIGPRHRKLNWPRSVERLILDVTGGCQLMFSGGCSFFDAHDFFVSVFFSYVPVISGGGIEICRFITYIYIYTYCIILIHIYILRFVEDAMGYSFVDISHLFSVHVCAAHDTLSTTICIWDAYCIHNLRGIYIFTYLCLYPSLVKAHWEPRCKNPILCTGGFPQDSMEPVEKNIYSILELARGDWYLISKYFVGKPTWNLNINLHNLSSKTFVCMVVVVFFILSGHGWAMLSILDLSMYSINPTKASSWWWFQRFFIFTPTWQDDPIWRAYFSDGLVQPPTSHRILDRILLENFAQIL